MKNAPTIGRALLTNQTLFDGEKGACAEELNLGLQYVGQ